jgi:tetratricopeptide (TPR) repeat protein
LNDIAWTFYTVVDDKKQLKQAVKWAQKSIKIDHNYYNHDTLAALYFKLGKKKKAIKSAKEAIKIAMEQEEDYSETQRLLDEIYKM